MRRICWLFGVALLCGIWGCEPSAHLEWAPDGSHGAYFVRQEAKMLPGRTFIVDSDGKVQADLGLAFGSMSWSSDSKTLYFGGYDAASPTEDNASRKWLIDPEDQPIAKPDAPANEKNPPMVLSSWHDGAVERLVPLGKRYVMFTQLAPNQMWLAVMTFADGGDDSHPELFVYNVESKKLYAVSEHCGLGMCFTADNKLAYVEADRDRKGIRSTGQIVEVTLIESVEALDRTPIAEVLWEKTDFLAATPDGLLFSTLARTFPGKARTTLDPGDSVRTIYHFTRADSGISQIAESTYALFMPSPDGKRLLYMTVAPDGHPADLIVANVNGSDPHALRSVSGYGLQVPLWPTWHGNDEITFISTTSQGLPAQAGEEPRVAFDVMLYKITADGKLDPGKALSSDWPIEMKPSMKKADFVAPK